MTRALGEEAAERVLREPIDPRVDRSIVDWLSNDKRARRLVGRIRETRPYTGAGWLKTRVRIAAERALWDRRMEEEAARRPERTALTHASLEIPDEDPFWQVLEATGFGDARMLASLRDHYGPRTCARLEALLERTQQAELESAARDQRARAVYLGIEREKGDEAARRLVGEPPAGAEPLPTAATPRKKSVERPASRPRPASVAEVFASLGIDLGLTVTDWSADEMLGWWHRTMPQVVAAFLREGWTELPSEDQLEEHPHREFVIFSSGQFQRPGQAPQQVISIIVGSLISVERDRDTGDLVVEHRDLETGAIETLTISPFGSRAVYLVR